MLGINQASNSCYAVAALLSYWVFDCRDRKRSPAMGTDTWRYLESSIRNSAEISANLEDYLQNMCDKLQSHLIPERLTRILHPSQQISRFGEGQIETFGTEVFPAIIGWQDLLGVVGPDGFTEWDILELCRAKPAIIQVLCRFRFEDDKVLKSVGALEDVIEVGAENV